MEPTNPEPSMEDILASIKRIIAEDGDAVATRERTSRPKREADEPAPEPVVASRGEPAAPPPAASDVRDEILELTRRIEEPLSRAPAPPPPKLVSADAETASRQSLAALSAMVVKPDPGGDNTLEGMVREMLRPVLKEWLDARLPDIVERMVAIEITRITGRGL